MSKLEATSYLKLSTGLMTEGAVSESQMPLDAVTESLNFKFNKIGAARLRDGTTLLGNQISAGTNILGLYEFRDSGAGTNNQIIAVNGTVVYYLSSGTWTSKRTGLTSGSKARFTTFLDSVWMVNGTEATAIWSGATGDSFVTTGNASSAPTGKFIERFRNRVWISGNTTYPDRLYYSSLPDSSLVITWAGDYVDISPADGENITGKIRTKSALLVFKNNHIYRVYSVTETEADPKINVGTYSNESIVEAKDGVYFHHPTGFYKYADGGVQEISKPITDIVKNITVANYSKVCGWLETNGDNIVWAVGDVTIDGTTYANLEVRYTISTETWTHYSKPTQALVASRYNDGTTLFQLFGDEDGNIQKVDVGITDNGTPISYSLIHRWYTVDGSSATRKDITKMLFVHNKGAGGNIAWQNEDSISNDWKPLLQLGKQNTGRNNAGVRGKKCRFRLSGTSTGEPFDYLGFEILEGNSQLII